jgi:predicted nucleic acid-binding protein
MFLLDTSVISELRKPNPNHGVKVWAHGTTPNRLFLSAITLLELETGILRVERRDPDQCALLRSWLERRVLPAFTGRILPIDNEVALRSIAHTGPQQRVRRINCCDRSGTRADRGDAQRGGL